MNSSKIPLLVTGKKLLFKLEGEKLVALIKEPRPILYEREGMYAWININQVKNAIRCCEDEEIRAKNNEVPYMSHITFNWHHNVTDVYLADAIKELLEEK